MCCHVLNRGNGRAEVFHDEADYATFVELMGLACRRLPMRVLGWCIMPNHFHLVLRPVADGDLARWMQWLMTSHVRRHHCRYGTSGHVWQGRFKSFLIQRRAPRAGEQRAGVIETGNPLWTVIRYAERNPLRAGLVRRAEDWPHSSLRWFVHPQARPAWAKSRWLERPDGWPTIVNGRQTDKDLAAVRHSVRRGSPFGAGRWVRQVVAKMGLESTVRPRGRPRKDAKK